MPALFAADGCAESSHRFGHVAVANIGAVQADALRSSACSSPTLLIIVATTTSPGIAPAREIQRDDRHHAVAVHDLAALVRQHHAVGVAVEGQSGVRPRCPYFRRHLLGVRRAAIHIDIDAVRFGKSRVRCAPMSRKICGASS